MTFLSALASENEAEVIFVTETHLSNNISDSEINLPGWGLARGDRLIRQSGGSMIFYRDQLTALHESSFSNSYVDVSMIYTPINDSAWIVVYRPPNCPAAQFCEAIDTIRKWTLKLEESLGKTPNLYMSGDFNMAQMGSWDVATVDEVLANSATRAANDSTIGNDKEQVLYLIKFIQDWNLSQEIEESTHSGNILDLLFTNNTESIEEVEVLENMKVTDHAFIIAKLNRESLKDTEEAKNNFCTTSIPRYNLKGASVEVWTAAREEFKSIKFNEDLNTDELCSEIIKALETVVTNNFSMFAPPNREGKKSKNFIPREARCLMKQKLNACRALKKTTNPTSQELLRSKISRIEDDLRKLIHKKRLNDENQAKNDLSKNPVDFFNLVRKMTKKI